MMDKIIQLAKENDYDSAEYSGKWKGYSVYVAVFLDDEPHFLGKPEIILEKGGEIRFGTPSETRKYLEHITPKPSKRLIAKCMKILNGTA